MTYADPDFAPDGVDPDIAADDAIEALQQVIEALPEGMHRPGQEEMCAEVARSVVQGKHLVASAQTGTGKSLAYLVPAVRRGEQVVVATATKALQDQLLQHDVPKISKGLGKSITAVTLKGRSNYLCAQKLMELREKPEQEQFDFASQRQLRTVRDEMEQIFEWADQTVVGDRSELIFEPSPATWQAVSVEAMECPGRQKCPSGDACFAERAIEWAADADVVIVNMHLYLLGAQGIPILPPHDLVVLDEAHQIEDVASSVFGFSVTAQRCFRLTDRLVEYFDSSDKKLCMAFTDAVNQVFSELEHYKDKEVPVPFPVPLTEATQAASSSIWSICGVLREALDVLNERGAIQEETQSLHRLITTAQALDEDIRSFALAGEGMAVWVESNRSALTWKASPIDVSRYLKKYVWDKRTAVLSSATIPPNYADVWGLEEDRHTYVDVPSPFDYKANSLLYVPKWMPRPGSAGYEAATHDEMEKLILAAGGRTLVLFTSWKALNEAVRVLRERLPFRILSQSDMPKPALMRAFSDEPATCLFGTLGLWQGVDVPGESLSQVIIPRLPFPRPDDPLLQARRRIHGDSAFMEVDVPIVATRMAQGVGRLIRTETDRGTVVVLDSRLVNSGYGKIIWKALPPSSRTTERDVVLRFLERCDEAAAAA